MVKHTEKPMNLSSAVESEGARRATGDSTAGAATGTPVHPDPEVPEKRQRRKYTAAYKILEEADRCVDSCQIGAILRREGLYSSNLTTWRRQCEAGAMAGLKPRKRGRKAQPEDPMKKQVEALQRENKRLNENLRKAEIIIDVQKKVSELLGCPLNPNPDGEKR